MKDGSIDLKSGDFARLLRVPDLRLVDLEWVSMELDKPFLKDFPDTNRAAFYFVQQGAAYFRTGPGDDELKYITRGTAVGVEGHPHQWMDASQLHASQIRRVGKSREGEADLPLKLIVSSIDRSAAVLQRLPHGAIVIPEDAAPYSEIISGCVKLIELERTAHRPEPGTLRRLAEVIMLQLVGFARSRLLAGTVPTIGLQHDEFLLRAMTAFFAEPGKVWTVASLAQAAGLSRAAFSERFSKAFGEPPLRTINRLRLHQGAEMLGSSNASLSDIAQEIGFGSAAAFLRAFKKQFEMTPGDWRRHYRNSA